MIILLTGLPGSGKTQVSKYLHARIPESIILRNDEIRRELFEGKPYSADQKELMDETVLERSKAGLAKNQTVILDRVSPAIEDRELFRALAHNLGTKYIMISISASESLIKERMDERSILDPLSAPFGVYQIWAEKYAPADTADYNIINDGDLIALEKSVDEIVKNI